MRKLAIIFRIISKVLALSCVLMLFSDLSFSQIRGDFKTITSGNWNSSATWQMFDGSTWKDTTTAPGPSNSVYIGNNHSVTLTQDENCNNLNLHTGDNQNRITTGSYRLNVGGKLRAYTGAAPGASTSALPFTNNWINTSNGGRILVAGNSRYITNTGEWGGNPPGWRLEVALNTGETGVFNTSLKAAHIILTSGTVVITRDNAIYPDSGVYGSGTVTIQSQATLRFKAGTLQRLLFPGSTAHFARLDLNGTLAYDSTVVGIIGAAIINFNGTVAYSSDGAQTFLTRGTNSNGAHPNTYTNIELNGSGIKTLGLNTTVNGKLKLAGTSSFSLGSYTLTYGGSSTLEYAGSIAQTTSNAELPATGAAPNLAIDNSNGVTLHGSRTVAGQLTLSNGTISTGSYTLSIGSTGSVSRTNGHVVGTLQKHIPTGSPAVRYEIGDVNNYTPVDLSFDAVTTAGQVTAGTVTGDHPELTSSMINGSRSVNRYWTVTNSGTDFSTCDAVFNFVSSDVDGGATPDEFIVEKYDSPDWTSTNIGTRASTSTEVTGLTSFSDFAIGEIKSYTITATSGSNGSITPSGAVTVPFGEDQQFIINPNEGYHVSNLLVDSVPTDSTTSYTFYNVSLNHSIEVAFAINTYILTVNAINGTVTKNPDQTSYNHGSGVQLTAESNPGYHFVSWSGDAGGPDNPVTIIMNGPKTVTATFATNIYNITATSGLNGSITPAGIIPVAHGGNQSFTIEADPNYLIDDVLVDGISVGEASAYEFTNVTINHTIYASFSPSQVAIEFTVLDGWNLVSVPVGRDDYRKTILFPTAQSDAFAYNGMYEVRDTLTNGEGYWLKFDANQPISISGTPRDIDTLEVNAGWNIIGSLTEAIPITSVIPLGTMIESYFFVFRDGYQTTDSVITGEGVWIKVSEPGQLVLLLEGAKNRVAKEPSEGVGVLEGLNSLRVTDEANNSRMLYFGHNPDGEFSTALYELPPIPPEGVFDARFVNNRYVALHSVLRESASEYTLNIQSGHWPITVSWDVEANNEIEYILEYESKGKVKKVYLTGIEDNITLAEPEGSSLMLKVNTVAIPKEYILEQNYPNPFNPTTTIRFALPMQSVISLKVYNLLGQEVATLIDKQLMDAGYREVEFITDNLSTGVYFINFDASSVDRESGKESHYTGIKKMIYAK